MKIAILLSLLVAFGVVSCASSDASPANLVRVGHFPNITHSQAIIGLARGDFARELGTNVKIEVRQFNAGPSAIEALFAGSIDLCYIGPNPAINGYVKSRGAALKIIAGATSGGAIFVVRPGAGIRTMADFSNKKIATPQLGNTQDVALRAWLKERRYEIGASAGMVEVLPGENPRTLDLFRQGKIDGAWVPEPWAARLEVEADGKVFLDERDLWPAGDFVTAHVIVSAKFLKDRPELVRAWLRAHVGVTAWIATNAGTARMILNGELKRLTGKALPEAVLAKAWARMKITWDPVAASLKISADGAHAAGFLKTRPDLSGIYALDILNEVLAEQGLPTVRGL